MLLVRRIAVSLGAAVVALVASPLVSPASVASAAVTHTAGRPSASATHRSAADRIIAVAKRHVGDRYRDGGASPGRGFDCSGFTQYVYAHAGVAKLPHNAQAQRRMKHMRRISARAAKRGDLVFYLSGGTAYHVAIYAGHGWQYAAADERDGVRHQRVWSRQVEYRTLRR